MSGRKLLTTSELFILSRIFVNNHATMYTGITILETVDLIKDKYELTQTTVGRILKSLTEEGYLKLGIRKNRRRNSYYITEEGIKIIEDMKVASGNFYKSKEVNK